MKDHADHNKKLCDLLLKGEPNGANKNKFNDWVVTTAFYSSLHFVEHHIFPLEHGDAEYNSFAEFYNSRGEHERSSQHRERLKLVRKYMPTIKDHYGMLMDLCGNARYKCYKVSEEKAKKARLYLTLIEAAITRK